MSYVNKHAWSLANYFHSQQALQNCSIYRNTTFIYFARSSCRR